MSNRLLLLRQCHFLTWCFVVQYSLWISMCNWVWKMPRTVIFSKIASVILDMEKLEDCLSEDFLSILKPSEITKRQKMDQNKSIKRNSKSAFELYLNFPLFAAYISSSIVYSISILMIIIFSSKFAYWILAFHISWLKLPKKCMLGAWNNEEYSWKQTQIFKVINFAISFILFIWWL